MEMALFYESQLAIGLQESELSENALSLSARPADKVSQFGIISIDVNGSNRSIRRRMRSKEGSQCIKITDSITLFIGNLTIAIEINSQYCHTTHGLTALSVINQAGHVIRHSIDGIADDIKQIFLAPHDALTLETARGCLKLTCENLCGHRLTSGE